METDDRPVSLSNADELAALVGTGQRVLVEFHTGGCGLCDAMEPVLSAVARTEDVVVGTMNPRDDPVLIEEYDVRSVPKRLLFDGGELVAAREDGYLSIDEVREFVSGGE